ncbi:MAG: S41 family peptidase [Planctomycetaceae bacterium]
MQRRGLVHSLLAVCVLAIAFTSASPAAEQVDLSEFTSAATAARHGETLEADRQWIDAIRFYETALKRWPEDEDLRYGLRRTRVQFGVDRRYSDRSFEEQLLAKGRAESLDMLEDVIRRIQDEYVDNISVTRLVAHGTESLYMALTNDRFLTSNGSDKAADHVDRVKKELIRNYWNRPVKSALEARSVVTTVCELVRRELGIRDSVVVMEYVFGACNALDDYSDFLTPDRYNDLFGSIQGEFVGIGIEMEADKGHGMHLVNVLLDSPAEEGGLRPGDHIVEISGQDCREMSTDEAARLLRGKSGSTVRLTFESPDGTTASGSFTRRSVQVRSVTRALIIDERQKIGYIRLAGFQSSTPEEMSDALRQLEREGMRALIWDLRGNPGGLLDTAASVADQFIDEGTLVSTEGRADSQAQTFTAQYFGTRNYPLVLLVDENSASASEIVAGAIRDHARGRIVGRKTYGKWSVQSIIQMPGNTGLKLTTAKFYSPDHKNYAGKGLEPDELVELPKGVQRTFFRGRTGEEISEDPDVARGLQVLTAQITGNPVAERVRSPVRQGLGE